MFIPPKNFHFSENSQNIVIQNFERQKMVRAYVCMKISEYPPLCIQTNIHAQSNPCQSLEILLETESIDDLRATTSRLQVIAAFPSRLFDTCNY